MTQKPTMCESCMMPFTKDPKGEARENEKYCSYCYRDGGLAYPGTDVHEFKRDMVEAIVSRGEPRWKAKMYAFMAGFAPRWKGERNMFGALFGGYGKKCADGEVKTR